MLEREDKAGLSGDTFRQATGARRRPQRSPCRRRVRARGADLAGECRGLPWVQAPLGALGVRRSRSSGRPGRRACSCSAARAAHGRPRARRLRKRTPAHARPALPARGRGPRERGARPARRRDAAHGPRRGRRAPAAPLGGRGGRGRPAQQPGQGVPGRRGRLAARRRRRTGRRRLPGARPGRSVVASPPRARVAARRAREPASARSHSGAERLLCASTCQHDSELHRQAWFKWQQRRGVRRARAKDHGCQNACRRSNHKHMAAGCGGRRCACRRFITSSWQQGGPRGAVCAPGCDGCGRVRAQRAGGRGRRPAGRVPQRRRRRRAALRGRAALLRPRQPGAGLVKQSVMACLSAAAARCHGDNDL